MRARAVTAALGALALMVTLAPGPLPGGAGVTDAAWTDSEWVHAAPELRMPRDCTTTGRYATTAHGRFLGGWLRGVDLDTVAAVSGLRVDNPGTPGAVPTPGTAHPVPADAVSPDAFRDPLEVTAVNGALTADLTGVVAIPTQDLQAGLWAQYARASSDGEAAAASGAVTDSGAVRVGAGRPGPADGLDAAVIDLGELTRDAAPEAAALAGLRLEVGALAASALLDGCLADEGQTALTREYGIAELDLVQASPAVVALTSDVTADIQAAVDTAEGLLEAELAALGGLTGVSASITVDLDPVTQLLDDELTDGVVTVDLGDGTVAVDLAALLGGDDGLNDLPPSSELLLDPAAVAGIVGRTDGLLAGWAQDVTSRTEAALRSASVRVQVQVLPLLTETVEISGTVQELLDGNPTITPPLGLGALLATVTETLATTLEAAFLGADGAVAALRASLLAAAPEVGEASGAALGALAGLVSLVVNEQWSASGVHGVSALRVGALDGSPLRTSVRLAAATVGPSTELR